MIVTGADANTYSMGGSTPSVKGGTLKCYYKNIASDIFPNPCPSALTAGNVMAMYVRVKSVP